MRSKLLAYSIGIMLASGVSMPAVALGQAGLALAVVLLVQILLPRLTGYVLPHTGILIALLAGASWHFIWADINLQARLPVELEGRDMWVTGVVSNLPVRNPTATQFQFHIDSSDLGFVGRRVLLNYYGAVSIETGQRWRLLLRLNRPHGFANPGGFDYEAWLFQQGIAAKGYVRQSPNNQLLGEAGYSLQRLRFDLRERLLAHTSKFPSMGILLALSLGERSLLQVADWQLMSASGTNHLFVISGLHIGLIAAAAYWLANASLRRVPVLGLYYPRQKCAAWVALLAALLYSLLAGFTLPTQRAFIMTAAVVVGQLGGRALSAALRFLLALAVVLTLNPLAALSGGFWMSFTAVGALLMCLNAVQQRQVVSPWPDQFMQRWLGPQVVVFLALVPWLLLWTQQVSILSPLYNLLAIPLVGLVVVPLTLAGVCLLLVSDALALPVLTLSDVLVTTLFEAIAWTTRLAHWSLLEFPAMSWVTAAGVVLAMVLLLMPAAGQLRWLALPLCLPAFAPFVPAIPPGIAHVHILDVGQGLSVVVQTRSHVLVYDTGAALSPEFNLGTAVVLPVLRRLGVSAVDAVVISHFDNDHAGGLAGLLAAMPVYRLLSSAPEQASQQVAAAGRTPALMSELCTAGLRWRWDGVEFAMLHPPGPAELPAGNNGSCVLRIAAGEHGLLLPGDIEQAAERALALRYGRDLDSSILVAPHHGSNTSSTYAFIKQVMPHYVIFAAGYRNSFGHPTPRTRARYATLGSVAYTTHATGMLSLRLVPGQPLAPPRQWRQVHPRYWY